MQEILVEVFAHVCTWLEQTGPHAGVKSIKYTELMGRTGQVRVGDLVGIHYPHLAGQWIGCKDSTCSRSSCPGQPTTMHGFTSEEHWYTCCGNVLKLYASGKNNSDVINGDDIMIYILDRGRWWAQGEGAATTTTCGGTSRPPPADKFDACHQEMFTIWKKSSNQRWDTSTHP